MEPLELMFGFTFENVMWFFVACFPRSLKIPGDIINLTRGKMTSRTPAVGKNKPKDKTEKEYKK